MLQLKLAGFDFALGSYEGELAGHEVYAWTLDLNHLSQRLPTDLSHSLGKSGWRDRVPCTVCSSCGTLYLIDWQDLRQNPSSNSEYSVPGTFH